MGLLARLLRRRYRVFDDLRDIDEGRVEVQGRVEALDVLHDPLHGEPCVAIEYRAWPPTSMVGMDGGNAQSGRAFELAARQAVDFVLADGTGRVLIQAAQGDDLAALHHQLLHRFGVQLRAEVETVPVGSLLHVAGRVTHRRGRVGSPMRSEPYVATVHADRFWLG
jgi:hypothetical protein